MIPFALKILTIISCVSIVVIGLFMTINKMGPKTSHWLRVAWILITWSAFGMALSQLSGDTAPPTSTQTVGWVGLLVFLLFDRRDYFSLKKYTNSVKAPDSAN